MTTPSAELACRHLASLWPAPVRFAAVGRDGGLLAGDAGLAARAAALLAGAPATARVVGEGPVHVARAADGGIALAALAPDVPLPGLLEADLRRMTSAGP